jgi:hypothetical protein
MRPQGVYTLKPRVPFDQYRERAARQPTRARAVLALIDLCDRPTKTLRITVLDNGVQRDGDWWLVRFEKGAHDKTDRARLLRATAPVAPVCTAVLTTGPRKGKPCGRAFPDIDYLTGRPITTCTCGAPRPKETVEDRGYTARKAVAMKSEGEAVLETVQDRITERAEENHTNGYILQRERLLAVVAEIRAYARTPETIKTLRGVERQVKALDRKMMAA